MDEEMEVEPVVFEAYEVDIEYEFDAARFFDFTRDENRAEACGAELWFESAESYPPSPFVARLFLSEGYLLDTDNALKKSEVMDHTLDSFNGNSNRVVDQEDCSIREGDGDCQGANIGIFTSLQNRNAQKNSNQQLVSTSVNFKALDGMDCCVQGSTSHYHPSLNKPSVKASRCVKPSTRRGTTVMKPTASHLARQNWPIQLADFKAQKAFVKNSETSFCSSGTESHAIKKQKLDGGLSRKVNEMKQQTSLVHKLPKKDGIADQTTSNAKLKLTIPREPDLETAHRAQRIRQKSKMEEEHTTTTRRFRARPLNRKILQAPSLPLPKKSTPKQPEFHEFHLRTSERAMQNTSAISSTSFHLNNSETTDTRNIEFGRSNTVDDQKHDGGHVMQTFKACPLNPKIFSSKGDMGVFRSSKLEATIPTEFKFHNEKRILQPPTELFNKLSLTSQLHSNGGSMIKVPSRLTRPPKSSKENNLTLFQPVHKITPLEKETPLFTGKLMHWGSGECIS